VVDLDYGERPVGPGEMTRESSMLFLCNFRTQTLLVPFSSETARMRLRIVW
jgi:hypothetical protein